MTVTSDNNSALIVEAYKSIRSELTDILGHFSDCHSFTVTSPCSGDGKTTTAINIAIAFSQLGKRVLLIDADLRNGSVHRRLHTTSLYGLSELLKGECSLDETIFSVGTSFDVITAGEPISRPASLFASQEFDDLISGLKLAYDYIIIDTPSVCERKDVLRIAPKTDGAVLVIRDAITHYKKIDRAMDLLADNDISLLGSVLNAAKINDDE